MSDDNSNSSKKDGEGNVSWDKDVDAKGKYQRKDAEFRDWIKADPGAEFPAAANRYHLYVSYACPWASRCLALRELKGLTDVISVDVVDTFLPKTGWTLEAKDEGSTLDTVNGFSQMSEIYFKANANYTGRFTVPVLWDKEKETIVSNESSEIIVMLNSEFNAFSATPEQAALDLYPEELREEIDAVNERVYHSFNNGVYKCGFAKSQEAYEEAFGDLFETVEWMEAKLGESRYLVGDTFTLADIRAFVTLIRFDPVYVSHFKTNKYMIRQLPNLWGYTKEIFQMEGISNTVRFDHIRKHYFASHTNINPTGVVAIGPDPSDLLEPHGRGA